MSDPSIQRTCAAVLRARLLSRAVAGCFILAAGSLVWVYLVFEPSRHEVAAAPSPDGLLIATVVEIDGGSTTAFEYEILVGESGASAPKRKVASLYGAVRNASAYGVNLRWSSPRELAIEYLEARAAQVLDSSLEIAGAPVAVVLRPNVTDPSAPAGGMLHNLKNHAR